MKTEETILQLHIPYFVFLNLFYGQYKAKKKRKNVSDTSVHCYVKSIVVVCSTMRWPHFFPFFKKFIDLFLFLPTDPQYFFTDTEKDEHMTEIGKYSLSTLYLPWHLHSWCGVLICFNNYDIN